MDGKAAPAIYTVHSTAPAYQENRVLVSARDVTTTTFVVHTSFEPVPCDCYAGTCNAFDSSCVCDAEWCVPVAMPIVLEVCLPRQGKMCDTASGWGCVCNETFGGPGCNVRNCPRCPLHSLCLEKAQTSTLSGRASVRARGREPDVTGAPVQIIAPAWGSSTKQRASANVTCNTRGRTAARKPR